MGHRAAPDLSAGGSPKPPAGVFIGGSAGGIEALAELLARLPADLAAPVLVVLHVGMHGTSVLPAILDRVGSLHAVTPVDGETPVDGVVYVAPRGQHMVVDQRGVRLNEGPTEHGVRPAIDPLFRSAARTYGSRAIGIVLSGMLDDGTAGLGQIRAHGGWTLVQQPSEAAFANMPQSAIDHVDVDCVLPVAELADRVGELVDSSAQRPAPLPPPEPDSGPAGDVDERDPPGMRTDITCPLCGGVLWEEVRRQLTMYRCRSGHAYSADSLLAVQGEGLDTAIWRPIRMLQERGALLRRLGGRASAQGRERSARHFEEQADDAFRRAAELRRAAAAGNGAVVLPQSERQTRAAVRAEQR
jgi:two-component system, chemotaxis family, protein-glutamate methylesterase/glutaminase